MIDNKDIQIKSLARALSTTLPQATRVAGAWAEKLYEQGVRVHPDLVTAKPPAPPQGEPQGALASEEMRKVVEAQAMRVVKEMASQFPQLQPLVAQLEQAKTPEERNNVLIQLRDQTSAIQAQAAAHVEVLDDNSQ